MFLFVKQKIENIDIYYNHALNLKYVKWNKTKKEHIYKKIMYRIMSIVLHEFYQSIRSHTWFYNWFHIFGL